MESDQLKILLEKYWRCETSLEEEEILRVNIKKEVPIELKNAANLFHYFEQEKKRTITPNPLNSKPNLNTQKQTNPLKYSRYYNYIRIPVGIMVMVVVLYLAIQELHKPYKASTNDTFTNPKIALEETKKALLILSYNFNKAHKEASRIKIFYEAKEKIQSKHKNNKKIPI